MLKLSHKNLEVYKISLELDSIFGTASSWKDIYTI